MVPYIPIYVPISMSVLPGLRIQAIARLFCLPLQIYAEYLMSQSELRLGFHLALRVLFGIGQGLLLLGVAVSGRVLLGPIKEGTVCSDAFSGVFVGIALTRCSFPSMFSDAFLVLIRLFVAARSTGLAHAVRIGREDFFDKLRLGVLVLVHLPLHVHRPPSLMTLSVRGVCVLPNVWLSSLVNVC